jgi:hypothetical protein
MRAVLDEESTQPLLAHIRFDGLRIAASRAVARTPSSRSLAKI